MSKNKTQIIVEPGKQEIFIAREFDAPKELVYKAHIDPKLFVQWIGPRGLETNLEVFEPVSGGKWRFVQKDENGEYGFRGMFHTVSEDLVIQTFEFDGVPNHVSLETIIFEKLSDNRTKLTSHSVFQSVSDRDAMVQSGMEQGVVEGYERLDEALEKM